MSVIHMVNQGVRSVLRTAGCLSIVGTAALTFASVVAQAQINGVVDSPRQYIGVVAPDTRMQFGGRVNFQASQGQIQIDVLKSSNLDRTKSSCVPNQPINSDDEKLWAKDVAKDVAPVKIDTPDPNHPGYYRWYTTARFLAFQSAPGENRLPDGGIARIRVRAIVNGKEYFLQGLDSKGFLTTGCEIIFGSSNPTPATNPIAVDIPNFLGKKGPPRPEAEITNYYHSVGTDPLGTGPKIDDPDPTRGIRTLTAFKTRYGFNGAGQSPLRVDSVRYFNQGDLGIGRRMFCAQNPATFETACYVQNYAGKDAAGNPVFDDFNQAADAMKQDRPFATVAMVERGLMAAGSSNRTFFVVYGPDEKLLTQGAKLDNKQYNTNIPGNCVVCHGGRIDPSQGHVTGVIGATFLPFDVNSFRYFDYNLQIADNNNTRGDLEPKFKSLNQIVYSTDLYDSVAARTLINGWYGQKDPAYFAPKSLQLQFIGQVTGSSTIFPRPTFDDTFVPPDWKTNDDSQQLYKEVVAPYCRTCHVASPFNFGKYADFSSPSLKPLVYKDVCGDHTMPNAEMTSKLLWRSNARIQILDRLQIPGGCGVKPPTLNTSLTIQAVQAKIEEPIGCPAGFVAKSSFALQINNPYYDKKRPTQANKKTVSDLQIEIASVTNGNVMLLPDGTVAAPGARLTLSGRQIRPGGFEEVPVNVCLKQQGPSNISVNVLGTESEAK